MEDDLSTATKTVHLMNSRTFCILC